MVRMLTRNFLDMSFEDSIKQLYTLPETNIAHENPIFPGKYHQNGGFSMAMLVSGRVIDIKRLQLELRCVGIHHFAETNTFPLNA